MAEYAIVFCDPAIVAGTVFLISLLVLVVSSVVVIGVLVIVTIAAIVCKGIADVSVVLMQLTMWMLMLILL